MTISVEFIKYIEWGVPAIFSVIFTIWLIWFINKKISKLHPVLNFKEKAAFAFTYFVLFCIFYGLAHDCVSYPVKYVEKNMSKIYDICGENEYKVYYTSSIIQYDSLGVDKFLNPRENMYILNRTKDTLIWHEVWYSNRFISTHECDSFMIMPYSHYIAEAVDGIFNEIPNYTQVESEGKRYYEVEGAKYYIHKYESQSQEKTFGN